MAKIINNTGQIYNLTLAKIINNAGQIYNLTLAKIINNTGQIYNLISNLNDLLKYYKNIYKK